MTTFVAPGKLVLCGEYAVLDGAPAISAAVDSGVMVTHAPSPSRRIQTPGDDDRFVRAALDAAGAVDGAWCFADWRPLPTATKPGIGGSAAATVAATLAACPGLDPAPLHAKAQAVHHAVQGSGSGVDVATSAWGGVIRFEPGARVTPLSAPPFVVVWSGQSAQTAGRIQRYRSWNDRDAFVRASAELADRFAADPIDALEAAWQLLDRADRAAGLEWATPAHARIRELARSVGGAAKPSGAGGGDCAIAVLPDPESSLRFSRLCADSGLVILPLSGSPGARSLDAPPAPQ